MRFTLKIILCGIALLLCPTPCVSLTVTDTIATHIAQMRYHLRVRPQGGNAHAWGVEWQTADSAVRYIDIRTEAETSADPAYGYLTDVVVGCRTAEHDTVTDRMQVCLKTAPSQTGVSLIILIADDRAAIEIGSDRVVHTQPINMSLDGPATLTARLNGRGEILRHTLYLTPAAGSEMMPFATAADLYDRLRQSNDPYEGIWTYYDRNNDPLRSRLGGRYTLATVAAGDGDYHVIYLAGAGENVSDWPVGRIKGRLHRATFEGVFDMEWIEPDGVVLSNDVGALFEGDLLSLLFPLWKTTVRLRRIAVPAPK